jgi:YD repeat-containing protein
VGSVPTKGPNPLVKEAKGRRLRSITCGTQTLLECSYGSDGKLARAHYFNGETVFYERDDVNRTRRTRTSSGQQVVVQSRADDLIESITYDNSAAFRYQYDNDNITGIAFPDGIKMERTFTSDGDVSVMNCAGVSSTMRWTSARHLEGYELFSGQEKFAFRADAKHHWSDLVVPLSPANRYFPILHALGAWRTGGSRLEEMLTPWGDRFSIQATNRNQPTTTWSPKGQTSYAYSSDGNVNSINRADGSLSTIYSFDDGLRKLIVHPGGISLLHFNAKGQLLQAVDQDGNYTRLKYAYDGRLKRSDRESGLVGILDTNKFAWVAAPNNFYFSLTRSPEGALSEIDAGGLRKDPAKGLRNMLDFIWRWLGLRTNISFTMDRSLL